MYDTHIFVFNKNSAKVISKYICLTRYPQVTVKFCNKNIVVYALLKHNDLGQRTCNTEIFMKYLAFASISTDYLPFNVADNYLEDINKLLPIKTIFDFCST